MIEQIADRSDDELQSAFGQNIGLDQNAKAGLGEIGCLPLPASRLPARRPTASGELFEHSPNGKLNALM